MFCIHCGNKVLKDTRFCSKCGEAVNTNSSQEPPKKPKPEETTSVAKRPPAARRISGLILVNIFLSIIAAFIFSSNDPQLKNSAGSILIIFLAFINIWLLVELLRVFFKSFVKFIRLSIKRPVVGIGLIAVVAALTLTLNWAIGDYNYKQIKPNLGLVQDNLAEAFVAKSVGDAIKNGKSAPYSIQKVGQNTQTVSGNLALIKSPSRLNDYKLAAGDWVDEIVTFSKEQKNWDALAQDPGPFTLKLTNGQAQSLLKESAEKIASLKDYGDDAIARGDREAMRYVAAKLQVQNHWLEGIDQSQDPSFFSLGINPVYALGRKIPVGTLKRRNPCISKTVCADNIKRITQGVYRSALGYMVGEKDANGSWDNTWKDAAPLIEASGFSTGGTGITQGDEEKPKYPPAVQAFISNCGAKGGTIGGTGTVKERMPTTEDGRTCKYQGGACWDMLTYSGSRYMGGNPGCPEQGLLPKITVPTEKPTTNPPNNNGNNPPVVPRVTSWDGVYNINANVGCNVPGIWSSGLLPSATRITVKGNRVYDAQGGSYPINSSGQARMVININFSGASIQAVQTYAFYQSGGQAQVKGNITVSGGGSVEGQSFSLNCSGSYSGQRVSS
ncbi:MAG: zinc-ribbon domain-containing protein [Candidatus Curtissbacteria bacterium]|nr:zinc-ribbon domain-containing protein [Candidatus Curtissbacteria bacterium]